MITQKFNIYLHAGIAFAPVVHASQYSQGETWTFTILDNDGSVYRPSSGALIGVKADGRAVAGITGTVNADGSVSIVTTQQLTAAAGRGLFELTIDGGTNGTANFIIEVEKKPTDDAVLSESDLSIIQQGINSVTPAVINETVSDYLEEHMTNPPIDPTLTISNAAADAKVTGDKITDLKNAIETVSDATYNGITTPSKTWVQGLFNSNGGIDSSLRRICAGYGYFPKDTKITIQCNGQYFQLSVFKNHIGSATNERISYTAWQGGNTTMEVFVPVSGYVGFDIATANSYGGSAELTPADYAMVITFSTASHDKISRIENTLKTVVYDYSVIEDGKMLNNNAYNYRDASSLTYPMRTPYISCAEGDSFTYFGRADYNYSAVFWRDADGNPIGKAQTGNAVGTYTFTAPANSAYAEFSSYGAEQFNVYKNDVKQVGNIRNLIHESSNVVNPLSGKNLLFIGDSITEGINYNGGWVTLVQNRNNCNCVNEGHGGWTVGKTPEGSSYNNLNALVGRLTGSYDYVILSGGYNDFTTAPRAEIGTVTPYTYSSLTADTFCGDFENYIRTARTKWIDSKICFILTMKKEFTDTTVNERQLQYWNIIRDVCKKYSIPLLDLYKESGLVGVSVSGVTDLVTETYYHNADGTHPNQAGYNHLIERIESFIKSV